MGNQVKLQLLWQWLELPNSYQCHDASDSSFPRSNITQINLIKNANNIDQFIFDGSFSEMI